MDRTSEFAQTVVLLNNGTLPPSKHIPLSQFSRYSQRISENLCDGEKVVNRLAILVNNKGFLNDPTKEIAEITSIFRKDIDMINQDIANLHALISSSTSNQLRDHFTIVSNSLKTRMAQSAKVFQDSLQARTTVLKEQSSRRSRFSHIGRGPMVQIDSPMFLVPSKIDNKEIIEENVANRHKKDRISVGRVTENVEDLKSGGLRHRGNPLMMRQPSTVQQVQQQFYSVSNAQSRLQEATQVENVIVELSGMFTKMATLVAEQGEVITRIDDDMDEAQSNVDSGQTQLLKYFQTVNSNRSLIIKIFLVLIFFIFLFVGIFK